MYHVCGIFKESGQVHAFPAVTKTHQMEQCTHNPCCALVGDMEYRDSGDKDSVITPLSYLYESENEEDHTCESPNNPPSTDTTS